MKIPFSVEVAASNIVSEFVSGHRMRNNKPVANYRLVHSGRSFNRLLTAWAEDSGIDLKDVKVKEDRSDFEDDDLSSSWHKFYTKYAQISFAKIPGIHAKTCGDCDGLRRVYMTEGLWASCDCVGGNGLYTNAHEY